MRVTLLVEPDPGGHRFQAVANVAAIAGKSSEVVLLTSVMGSQAPEFATFLSEADLRVEVRYAEQWPDTEELVDQIARFIAEEDVERVVVLDADTPLKQWWRLAPKKFAAVGRKPSVIFMLTRYPTRIGPLDARGWAMRVAKSSLVLVARARGVLHRTVGFAGRDDTKPGWIVARVRDPEICLAHSRDRAELRELLGLPADRTLIGLFGALTPRKNAPMLLEVAKAVGPQTDLVLAGKLAEPVRAWLDGLGEADRARVIAKDQFLDDLELDQHVAAVDAVPIVLTNNGPSGIMGKALVAGVPVVSAGSQVRARELRTLGGGLATRYDVASIAEGVRRVLAGDGNLRRNNDFEIATAEEFGAVLLGDNSARRGRSR